MLAAHLDEDDVLSAAAEGMVRALNRFDPTRRTRFSTFARPRIRGAIRRELGLRRPAATGLDLGQVADHRVPPLPGAEPMFGCRPLVPDSPCPHPAPHPARPFVCMICHATAFDSHPALQIGPTDRPPPRRRPKPGDPPPIPRLAALRERRMRQFSRAAS